MRVVVALGGNALLKRGEPMTAEVQRHNVRTAAPGAGRGRGGRTSWSLPRQRTAGRAARAPGVRVRGGRGLPARRPGRADRGHDRLRPRAGARQPPAVRGAVRDRPHDGRGRSGGSGVRRPDEVRRARLRRSRRRIGWRPRRAGPSSSTGTGGGASCRPRSRSASSRSGRSAGSSSTRRSSSAPAAAASRRCTRRTAERTLVGVEAVIDKDLASELLAREVDADLFVMATDVDGVYADWGTPQQRRLERVTAAELGALPFAAGSMGPKVGAAIRFVERTGKRAAIGALGGDRGDRRRRRRARRWSRRDVSRDRNGGVMETFGVHSEVGKLRKVMVHRPELSLQRLTPSNHDELLFDDVLWVERAQYEHDQFVARMRERGVEVFLLPGPARRGARRQRRGPAAADRGRGLRVHGRPVAGGRGPQPAVEPARPTSSRSTSSAG